MCAITNMHIMHAWQEHIEQHENMQGRNKKCVAWVVEHLLRKEVKWAKEVNEINLVFSTKSATKRINMVLNAKINF
jgi:hypothetical protein